MRNCCGVRGTTVCGVKGLVALFPVVLGEFPRNTAGNPGFLPRDPMTLDSNKVLEA